MSADFYSLLPVIIPSSATVLILLVSAIRRSTTGAFVVALAALVAAAVCTAAWSVPASLFFDTLHLDAYARMGALACIGVGIVACLIAVSYLKRMQIGFGEEYFALITAAVAGMIVMVAASDLMVFYVNLELMSLATYILCGMNRSSTRSTESALKYFVTGATSSALMIFGIALLYAAFGTTNLAGMSPENAALPSTFRLLAAACLLSGFLFKIGVVPFHAWMPDVYQGAPTPVTAFMAAAVRIAAVMALVRFYFGIFAPQEQHWTGLIWWCAVLTMSLGNLAALVQTNVKRMLGYSSIAHAGYLLVGFAGLSSASPGGAEAIVYYLIAYSVMSLGIFAIIGQVEEATEKNLAFDDYRGMGLRQPMVGIAASIFLLSLTGIPPFAGFFGKLSLFSVAVHNGFVGLAVIGVINSFVSAYYYLKLLVCMYMREPDGTTTGSYGRAPLVTLAVAACAFLTIWFGIGPFAVFSVIPSVNDLWAFIESGISVLGAGF